MTMTYTIEDYMKKAYFMGHYDRVTVSVCPACNEQFTYIQNTDPGSTVEAIGWVDLCDKCHEQYNHLFLDWDTVSEIRLNKNLGNYDDIVEKFLHQWNTQAVKGMYPIEVFKERIGTIEGYDDFIQTVVKSFDYNIENFTYDLNDYAYDCDIEDYTNAYFESIRQ